MSKLEERRKTQDKQGKTGRNIFIALIIIGAFLIFAIMPSKKEDACNCVKTSNKWESNGAGFGTHTLNLRNELDRCRRKFDGINNARRICNE